MMRAVSILVLLVACARRPPAPLVVEAPADLTEEVLNRLVRELVPLVEEAAGRPFARIPHARLGRSSDLQAVLEAEYLHTASEMYDVPEWVLRQLAASARGAAGSVVGKWGVQTEVLYLSPEAVAGVTAAAGLPPERMGDVARLVIAHEMVHGLQAEVNDWSGLVDHDHFDALRALTEGHANFVERRVAERLDLEDARLALNAGQGWDEHGPGSRAAFTTWALYGQGQTFVAWHVARGGDEAAWAMLAAPPSSTTMIFRPETTAPYAGESMEDAGALRGVEEVLTEGRWVGVDSRIGELDLREALYGADADALDAVLAGVVGGTHRRAFRTDRSAVFRVIHLADADAARALIELVQQPRAPAFDVPWRDEIEVRDDGSVLHVSGPAGGGARQERITAWAAHGDRVIALQVEGFRPGRRLDDAMALVRSRL